MPTPPFPPPTAPFNNGRTMNNIIRIATMAMMTNSAARMMSFLSKPISGLAAVTPSPVSADGNRTLTTLTWSPRVWSKPTAAFTSCSICAISAAALGV